MLKDIMNIFKTNSQKPINHDVNIVDFYSGKACDVYGRKIVDIWEYNDNQLEYIHNYIQWLFPLTEKSMHDRYAPILCDQDIEKIRKNEEIKKNMLYSLCIMMRFYKIELNAKDFKNDRISREIKTHIDKNRKWLTPNNHNYLRMTRIIKSLKLFGMEEYAYMLYEALYDLAQESNAISDENLNFWTQAIKD